MAKQDNPAGSRAEELRRENAELTVELSSLRLFMSSMGELMVALDSPTPETEALGLLERVLDTLVRAVGAKDGSLLAPDDTTRELVFVIVRGHTPNQSLVGRRLPANAGIAGWVAQNRRATIVNNVPIDDRFYSGVDSELDYRTHSLLAAPLIGGGKLLGVVEVINKSDGRLFSTGNQTLLTLMCRFAGELLYSVIKDVDLTQNTLHGSSRSLAVGDAGGGGSGEDEPDE